MAAEPHAPEGVDPLPGGSGFLSLLCVRGLSLLNDHALKWLAIGLGKRLVAEDRMALVITIGLVGLSLPYVLVSWLAGALADRHPKAVVIRWSKAAEIGIMSAAAAAIAFGPTGGGWLGLPASLWLLLVTVMVIGTQAALMTPALVGALPETVPAARLAGANGVFALVSLACVLAGTAAGNWIADATPLAGPPLARGLPAAALLVAAAVAGWLAALAIPLRPAAAPRHAPAWRDVAAAWTDLRALLHRRDLAAAAAGIVFFWAIGAVAQANVDQFATEAGATAQAQIVPLLVALVAGIGVGSVVTGTLATRPAAAGTRVDLGYVPLGGMLMTIAFLALATGGRGPAECPAGQALSWWALGWLSLLGFGAGMFDVPLETFVQEKSPPERRGAMLAAINLLLFTGMFLASLCYGGLRAPLRGDGGPLLAAREIFALFALCSATAAMVAVAAAPRAALRLLVAALVHGVYRYRVVGADRIPASGPAVVVANHVSWLDGFVVTLSCPRPLRMVVYGPNIRGRFLRLLADQWRFILFDPRPKSLGRALETITGGLAEGDAVGIFCEGGISRHGQILGFKRGLEWLLDRVHAPIVPLHVDGMWGSVLSFSGGRFFRKWPRGPRRPLTLRYGHPLPVGTHPEEARLALQELTATAVRERFAGLARTSDPAAETAGRATAEAFDGACLVRRSDRLVSSLVPGDPLHDALGSQAAALLGIPAVVVPGAALAELGAALERHRATIWVARIDQIDRLADLAPSSGLAATLAAVVVPIAAAAELPRFEAAAERFRARFGIEPVVAYAPPEAGGLVAMNTPPARRGSPQEVTCKAGTVGRVVHGVVVWPEARQRLRLGLPSVAAAGVPDDSPRTLVIGATLPCPAGWPVDAVRGVLLTDSFRVDGDGFLVASSPAG